LSFDICIFDNVAERANCSVCQPVLSGGGVA